MKASHASDLHYCPDKLKEADRTFGFAVEDGIRRDVDVAFITGDSTDHAMGAHSPAFLALAMRIKQQADHCPVFMLQGTFSHEPQGMLKILELIGAKHPIVISDKIGMIGLSGGKWVPYDPERPGQEYQLVVSSVPTVSKAELAAAVGPERAGEEMAQHLAAIMASFASENEKLRRLGVPTVLVSHGTVDGSLSETGVPMAGLDHELTVGALFSANTDATMLGHIHKHQAWHREFNGRKQTAAFAGSIGRFHHGEIGEKHYLEWNLEVDNTTFEAIATPSQRMIDIDFDGPPDLKKLATVAEQCAGAFVRVRYQVDQEFASTIDRKAIHEILGLAANVQVEGEVLTIQRQRCAGISGLTSTIERFLKWCEFTSTPNDGLTDRVALLQSSDPETIAMQFMQKNKKLRMTSTKPAQPLAVHAVDDLFA